MKNLFTLMIVAAAVCSGYAQKTPPHAASTRTWVVEAEGATYIWSDYINLPECNKQEGDDCKRGQAVFYLYSMEYVRANTRTLCPHPWRMPPLYDPPLPMPAKTLSKLWYTATDRRLPAYYYQYDYMWFGGRNQIGLGVPGFRADSSRFKVLYSLPLQHTFAHVRCAKRLRR
jgi:hypothetical protein